MSSRGKGQETRAAVQRMHSERLTNKEIAARLGIHWRTVSGVLAAIYGPKTPHERTKPPRFGAASLPRLQARLYDALARTRNAVPDDKLARAVYQRRPNLRDYDNMRVLVFKVRQALPLGQSIVTTMRGYRLTVGPDDAIVYASSTGMLSTLAWGVA